jgi:hypothetical protein
MAGLDPAIHVFWVDLKLIQQTEDIPLEERHAPHYLPSHLQNYT